MDHNHSTNGSLLVLSEIISGARRRAGVAALTDRDFDAEVRDWARILTPIPADKLLTCYTQAMRHRTVKALLQPQELIAAWNEMRQEQSNRRAISLDPNPVKCYYCDGTGWQVIVSVDENHNENQSVRECACTCGLPRMRSEVPLREPHWQRDEFGRWHKTAT